VKKMFKWNVRKTPEANSFQVVCMGIRVYAGSQYSCESLAAAHNAQIDMFEDQLTALDVR